MRFEKTKQVGTTKKVGFADETGTFVGSHSKWQNIGVHLMTAQIYLATCAFNFSLDQCLGGGESVASESIFGGGTGDVALVAVEDRQLSLNPPDHCVEILRSLVASDAINIGLSKCGFQPNLGLGDLDDLTG